MGAAEASRRAMSLRERLQHIASGCLLHHDHHDHGERDLEKRGLVWYPYAGPDFGASRGMPYLTADGRAALRQSAGDDKKGGA